MSAETLRRAASLMRGRAAAATPGPWRANDAGHRIATTPTWEVVFTGPDDEPLVAGEDVALANYIENVDAHHIASWHPTVALAVAILLDASADEAERLLRKGWPPSKVDFAARHPLAVARAYLGQEP